jgi:peptidoglycan glycosyltransferase
MNGPIRRVAFALFAMFGVLLSAVTYFQVIEGPSYRDDPRNIRVVAGRAGRERGTVISADGVVIARSVTNPDDPRVFRRSYPEGNTYAHAVGYATLLFGASALERAEAEVLVSDRESTISGVINALFGGDLRPEGLRLTLEHSLQTVAADALGNQAGAVVAIDPATGAILAMVSKPGFDPNMLLGTGAAAAGDALSGAADRPLLNRTIGETYPPGSTFKIVTATAALETGAAGPGTTYPNPVELTLPGTTSTIRNFDRRRCGGGAEISLADAFAVSCNTTFAMIGLDLESGEFVDAAEAFGFGLDIPFDLTTLASAIPPASDFADDPPALAQSAIGQRDVRATPLQMALVAAGVANGGWIMTPYIVSEVFNSEGVVTSRTEPLGWQRAMSPSTADVLADLMERVVTSGTGSRAAVPGIRIAGKTGTAEVPGQSPHAWFVGFGPVDARPGTRQIAIAVLVESGGDLGDNATGGTAAAPIAQEVLSAFFEG